MGDIYSKATCVYMWLGSLPSLPSVKSLVSPPTWRSLFKNDLKHYRRRKSKQNVYYNEYWTRAWVVQEMLLARRLNIVLKKTALDFDGFLITIGYPRLHGGESHPQGGGSTCYAAICSVEKDTGKAARGTLNVSPGELECGGMLHASRSRLFALIAMR
ncbi:hypothetical protein CC86DRAFT_418443 [Ophiobolus disseminans]|uniref:Heterokaryon incompatibility domain-containing protein n=1 Tax=Ophiobolus disseminans TaxID=1469910 RepID=A0A6A6ZZC4_9PLEO|nr:hypothetical protein CC86DRAFT_418443 [Ophiobolus disseminans]